MASTEGRTREGVEPATDFGHTEVADGEAALTVHRLNGPGASGEGGGFDGAHGGLALISSNLKYLR